MGRRGQGKDCRRAERAVLSAVARYAGGHNAGHTVIIGGQKFVLQLIPCGVLRPGCKGVIGNGVVLDPIYFLDEIGSRAQDRRRYRRRLFVSNRAQVILPYHRMIELAAESAPGRQKIGTTSKGIGPAYEDKMARSGLRVVDLLHPALLKTHIEAACAEKNAIAHALFRHRSARSRRRCTTNTPPQPSRSALCRRYRPSAQRHSGQGRQHHVRGRAGNHARHRPRHLSVCDFVFGHGRRRGHRNRRGTDRDRHRHLRDQGLCNARGRRAVPHRDS